MDSALFDRPWQCKLSNIVGQGAGLKLSLQRYRIVRYCNDWVSPGPGVGMRLSPAPWIGLAPALHRPQSTPGCRPVHTQPQPCHLATTLHGVTSRAANTKQTIGEVFTIMEKAPTRAFSWLKAPTRAFTFKTLLRHYAKQALTPRSLNVKLGPRRNYQ